MSNIIQRSIDGFWRKNGIDFLSFWVTPNLLSGVRLALVPLVVGCLWQEYFLLAFGLTLVALITDSLDGALARERNQRSRFGEIIDPLADKALITAILGVCYLWYIASPWLLATILIDLMMISISTLVLISGGRVLAASYWGKGKMVAQSVLVIGFFIYLFSMSLIIAVVLQPIIVTTLVLTVGAAISYSLQWYRKS